jgi:hypothetical protein
MIDPASTVAAPADPRHSRTTLLEKGPDGVVLGVPGSDYRLHLSVYQQPHQETGKRVVGTIRAQARRIDTTRTGGRYIEPVYGRPRRIQGEVVAVDAAEQTVTINATVPIVCKTNGVQRAEQFKPGDFVATDLKSGASFVPLH